METVKVRDDRFPSGYVIKNKGDVKSSDVLYDDKPATKKQSARKPKDAD